MNVTAAQLAPQDDPADVLILGHFADGALSAPAQAVDRASGGAIARLLEKKEISGKAHEVMAVLGLSGIKAGVVLVAGLGPREKFDRGTAFRCAAAAARHAAGKPRGVAAFYLGSDWQPELIESGVCGAIVGCHGQDLYKAEKKRHPFGELQWSAASADSLASGIVLGESVNLARRLINEPAQEMFPAAFAERAESIAAETGLEVEVWDQARLERERCGALLAVAKGSNRPPRLVILSHKKDAAEAPTLALVGKGVTFDSGGLSLKPSDSMLTMKCDMSGGAAVLGAMQAIARLRLPVNVVGLVGLVENMTGGAAMKLGDVLTARSGKTIEVHNTDAEGRLVLADVLDVALERKPAKIIDLATLTGACVVALGNDVAGAMTNDQGWCDAVMAAASTCGEPIWQLPMFPEYAEQIRGEVADIKNVGDGRWGGAITAAKFLEEFVGGVPWVHLDIAGPAFLEKPKPWLDGGGAGAFVRTLVEIAREWRG